MTIVQLCEVTDEETISEYYEKTTNAEEFAEFKEMFNQASTKNIEESNCRLLRKKEQDEPSVIVFRSVGEYTYELRGTFPDTDGVEFKFTVNQKT